MFPKNAKSDALLPTYHQVNYIIFVTKLCQLATIRVQSKLFRTSFRGVYFADQNQNYEFDNIDKLIGSNYFKHIETFCIAEKTGRIFDPINLSILIGSKILPN